MRKTAPRFAACVSALAAWAGSATAQESEAFSASQSFDFLGFRTTILLTGAETGNSSALLDARIPANAGPKPHIHTREDEVYLIRRGTFQFFMDGICLQVGPGATLYLPKKHMHTFRNITQQPGEVLLFVYPAGLEQYFREVHELGLKMPQDTNKLNELSESKYGITYRPGYDFHAGTCTEVTASGAAAKK